MRRIAKLRLISPVVYLGLLAIMQVQVDWTALAEASLALDTILALAAVTYLLALMATYWRKPRPLRERRDLWAIAVTLVAIDAVGISTRLEVTQPGAAGLGMMLTLLGTVLALWSIAALRSSFSFLPQARQLVTHGPYALVRHPIYLAGLLIMAGEIIPRWSLESAILSAVFVGAQLIRLRMEEGLLANTFEAYAAYRANTPALIPGIY